jgi:hypothetical protein
LNLYIFTTYHHKNEMGKYSNHPLAGAKDIDSSMNMLWAFYKKYFIVLYIISVISALATNLITSGIDMSALQSTKDIDEILAIYKGMIGPYSLLILVSIVFGIVLHTYILDKPVESSYNFVNSLKKSVMVFFPYILTIIVLGIGGVIMMMIGFALLFLPGLFAAFYFVTICLFALPVILIENGNPGHAIGRSLQLTHRNFWPNMGWVSVLLLIVIIISVVIAGIIMLPFSGSFMKIFSDPAAAAGATEFTKNPLYIILSSLSGALVTPVVPIMAFILYFRNAEEKSETEISAENEERRVRVEDLYPKMPENNDQH